MGRGCPRRPLIVPMNLGVSPSAEVTRSMAAVGFGAFVPVGKIGSGVRHVNCLATPARVFPLGSFAFFCVRSGRVASTSTEFVGFMGTIKDRLRPPFIPMNRGIGANGAISGRGRQA